MALEKMKLETALMNFNRSERFWLIRNALGDKSEKLDPKFCKLLYEKHFIAVPDNAWWAMDYHLDWLVGALHFRINKDEETTVKEQENQELNNGTRWVNGSIEDIDLLIAFGETLIFIEAKGDEDWNYQRLQSKIDRHGI